MTRDSNDVRIGFSAQFIVKRYVMKTTCYEPLCKQKDYVRKKIALSSYFNSIQDKWKRNHNAIALVAELGIPCMIGTKMVTLII